MTDTNKWVFQANPKHYDIDKALAEQTQILWRVPQYTEQVRSGDKALIWRSGKASGVVGYATVQSDPYLAGVPDDERRFVLDDASEGEPETRVVLEVRASELLPKDLWKADSLLSTNKVVVAPMGTVFKLSTSEWTQALALMDSPEFPAHSPVEADTSGKLPVFSWADRKKDVYPLPGGYDHYLATLEQILTYTTSHAPSNEAALRWMERVLKLSPTSAKLALSFLRRVGFIEDSGGHIRVAGVGASFLESRDTSVVIAQLHQRCRFIGEMLAIIGQQPTSADALVEEANRAFGLGWTTKAQIQRRRGWLQSAGMIENAAEGLTITSRGQTLLPRLALHSPEEHSIGHSGAETKPTDAQLMVLPPAVDELLENLVTTSRRSESADDFEFALRDAFSYLGFRSEKVGGAGKTDVVADAELGRDDSYRIIIDGKTTKVGTVGDKRIDWETIEDHRKLHDADFVIIAAPEFDSSDRLQDRANKHDALLMTVSDISSLVRLHADDPLKLDDLRPLFDSPGSEFDIDALSAGLEVRSRFLEVTQAILAAIEANVERFGAMSARDLYVKLDSSEHDVPFEESEIQEGLEALSSPLVGALMISPGTDSSYRPTGPRSSTLSRLSLLHDRLSGSG